MTRLFNNPAEFMEDMLEGFVSANASYVMRVDGGVVRAQETRTGKVAVIVGGGSGHYPAFAGIVGHGFADGAVVGNIFTSPSAHDAISVSRAAQNGGGVVITSGNYAGDVMHFSEAARALTEAGIPARTVFVTDDIASAPAAEVQRRRGIAGDVVVFKVMSAAAEAGYSLDEVVRVGRSVNDATRTIGVAFAGCTLPGADSPLFTVRDGMMGVGLGIHGEPGISEELIPTASELAERLIEALAAELPLHRETRITAILNGLGGTKYEELFVVWASIARLLEARGVVVVEPEVGELVTSLDMAGCSLTITLLDDELETLWCDPADSPAFRKGALDGVRGEPRRPLDEPAETAAVEVSAASAASAAVGARITAGLRTITRAMIDAEEELGRIDAVAGDGDHGRGMVKGTSAAADAAASLPRSAGARTVLTVAGDAWASRAGGTSGALWGAALRAAGARLGDQPTTLCAADAVEAVAAALAAVRELGKAEVGDKTMVDALMPFVETLASAVSAGTPLAAAWSSAADAAADAARATAALTPRIGRARPLAERSVGTPDAGAVSLALAVRTLAPLFTTTGGEK